MDRKFVICTGIIILFLSVICKPNICKGFENEYFKLLHEFEIPDTSSFHDTGPVDVAIGADGNFYMVDRYMRRIVKTVAPFNNFKMVGQRGNGPSEYITPFKLGINHHYLYYSDKNNSLIKSIAISPNQNKHYPQLEVRHGACYFTLNGSESVYVMHTSPPHITQYSKSANNYITTNTTLILESFYGPCLRHILGGDIIMADNGKLFISFVSPYKLLVYNENLTLIETYDLEELPGVIPWTKRKYRKFQKNKSGRFLVNNATYVIKMSYLHNSSSKYILVHLTNPKGDFLYHLLSLQGELVTKFNSNLRLMASKKDTVYFYRERNYEDPNSKSSILTFQLEDY